MSQTIDNRIVELEFDNSDFEPKVKESLNSLEQLKSSLNFDSAAQNLTSLNDISKKVDISAAAENIENVSNKIVGKLSTLKLSVASALGNIFSGLTKDLIIDPIAQSISGGIARSQKIADAKFQLEGLGVAWERIKEDIDYAVDGTAYGLDSAAKAASQLTASGVEMGQEMKAALRGISGVAAMGAAEYDEIAPIFTKAAGQGRVMADELNRISAHGLNAASELAKFFNTIDDQKNVPEELKNQIKELTEGLTVSEKEIRDFASHSEISFEMFAYAMDNAFGEHAKDANKTFSGAMANMKAALSRIGEQFRAPIMDASIDVFNALRLMINQVKSNLQPIIDIWTRFVYFVGGALTSVVNKVTDFLKAFTGAQNISNGLLNILYSIASVVKTIASAFQSVFGGKKDSSFIDGMNSAAETFEKFTQKLVPTQEGLLKLKTVLSNVFKGIKSFTDVIKTAVSWLASKLAPAFKLVGTSAKVVLGPIVYLIANLDNIIGRIRNLISIHSAGSKTFTSMANHFGLLGKALQIILPIIDKVKAGLQEFGSFVGKILLSGLGIAIAGIVTAFNKLRTINLSKIKSQITGFITSIKSIPQVSDAINNIKSAFSSLKTFLAGVLTTIVSFFGRFRKESDTTSRSVTKDMSAIEKVFNGIKTVLGGLGALLGGAVLGAVTLFNKAFSAIKNFKMESVIKSFKDFIAQVKEFGLLNTISNKLQSGGGIIAEILLKIIEKIQEFIQEIKDSGSVLDFIIDKISSLVTRLSTARGDIAAALFGDDLTRGPQDSKLGKVIDTLKEKFQSLWDLAKKGFTWLQENGALTKALMIGYTLAILKSLISFDKNSTKIADAMAEGKGFFGMFNGLNSILNSTANLLNKVTRPFDALTDAITAWGEAQKKSPAENFAIVMKSMAVAIVAIAGSLALLYAVVDDVDKFKQIAIIMGIFTGAMIAVAGAMTIMAAVKRVDDSFFNSFAANMIAMSVCIGVMGLLFNAISKLNDKQLLIGILGLLAILGSFLIVQGVLAKIGTAGVTIVARLKGIVKLAGKMVALTASLTLVAISIAAMAGALMLLKNVGLMTQEGALLDVLLGLGLIATIFYAVMSMSRIIGPAAKGILQMSGALALLGLAAVQLVIVSLLMKAVDWKSLGKAGVALGGLAILMAVMARIAGGSGAIKGILALSASLVLLTLALENIALMAVLMRKIEPEELKKPMQVLLGLTILLAGLLVAAGSVKGETGLKSLIAIVVGLTLLIGSLMILAVMCGNDKAFKDILKALAVLAVLMAGWAAILAGAGSIKTGKSWGPILVVILGMGLIFAALYKLSQQLNGWDETMQLVLIMASVAIVLRSLLFGLEHFLQFAKSANAGSGKFVQKAMIAFGVMIAAFIAIAVTLAVAAAKTDGYEVAAMALTIGAAVVGLAFAARIIIASMKGVKWAQLAKAGASLGVMVIAIGALALIFSAISNAMNGTDTRALGSGADSPIMVMLGLVGMLFLMSLVFKQLGSMDLASVGKAAIALTVLTVIMIAIGAVLYVLGTLPIDAGILAKSQIVMLVLAELVLLTVVLSLVGSMALQATAALPALAVLSLIFLALGALLTIMGLLPIDTSILAKSQIVMLVLAELVLLTMLLGVFAIQGLLAIAALPALIAMTAIFAALSIIVAMLGLLPIDTSILAKSQIVMLVLLELVALTAVLGLVSILGLLAIAAIPALLGLTLVFGVLAAVSVALNDLQLEGMQEKMDVLTGVLWKMVGVLAVLGLLSLGAVGELAGAAAILMIAIALVPLTQALQNMEGLDFDKIGEGLKIIALGLTLLMAAGILGGAAGLGLIILAAGIAAVGIACIVAAAGVTMFATTLAMIGSAIVSALTGIVEGAALIVEGFKTKFIEIVDFVGDVIAAIKEKLSGVAEFFKAGMEWGSNLVQGFRNATGWNSPPEFLVKFFEDAGVTVNKEADGITDMFEGTGNTWGSAIETALGSKLSSINLGDLGTKMGGMLGGGLLDGSYPGIDAVGKLLEGLGFKTSKTIYSQQKLVEMMRTGQISSTEFNQRMKDLNSTTDKSISLTDMLTDGLGGLTNSLGKTGGAAGKTKDQLAGFNDSLKSTLEGQMDIFKKFEAKNPMNKSELLANMKSQIDGMTNWAGQMNKLATMGIDKGLYKKLAEMGPQGAEYVGAFASMTAEEMAQANSMWAQSLTLPGDIAGQVGASWASISGDMINGLSAGWTDNEGVFHQNVLDTSQAAQDNWKEKNGIHSPSTVYWGFGMNMMLGLGLGIQDNMNIPLNVLDMLCRKMIELMKRELNPMNFKTIGTGVITGIRLGIEEEMDSVTTLMEDLATKLQNAIKSKKALDERSPSHKFEQIGIYISQGLANGINKGSGSAINAVENLSDEAINSMKYTIASISAAINNEMEDPVIRPVLDLSNVQAGARSLNSIFSTNQSIKSGSALSNLQNGQYSGTGNVIFNQNNYSPKALSRIDIYRDTKNIMSQYKQSMA